MATEEGHEHSGHHDDHFPLRRAGSERATPAELVGRVETRLAEAAVRLEALRGEVAAER